MIEIATSLRAAQATCAMAKTFKNSPNLDKKKASPAALCVIDFARKVSVGLARRLTRSEAKRDAAILAFRCRSFT